MLRIFPLYYFSILALAIAYPLLHPALGRAQELLFRHTLVWYLTHLTNFAMIYDLRDWPAYATGHFWSLAVEEQFYLVWPLVIFSMNRKAAFWVCLGLVLIAPCFRTLWLNQDPMLFQGGNGGRFVSNYVLLPGRVDSLALGGAIALGARSTRGVAPVVASAKWMILGGIFPISLILLLRHGAFSWSDRPVQIFGFSALAVLFGGLVIVGATGSPATACGQVLRSRLLRTLGKYSYSMYIFHFPVYEVLKSNLARWGMASSSYFARQLLVTSVGFTVTLLIAFVTWHGLEKHVLKLKGHFETSPRTEPEIAGISVPRR